jgi:peptidoglycan hydrolase-like protein with peptidoglycan-binding domain
MTKGKIILGLLGTATLAVTGIYVYRRFFKKSASQGQGAPGSINPPPLPADTTFPMSFGSRGEKVKQLQRALMTLFPGSLPRYGADGIWGSETEAALKNNKQPTVIRKADFDRIIGAAASGKPITQTSSGGGVAAWF